MFTKVSFQNLRCFKDFTLENLTPVTLISGRNNVGKTTVLEGIYLSLAFRNASIFQILNSWRGIGQFENPLDIWENLFADMDSAAVRLSVSVTDDSGMTRSLHFEKEEQRSLSAFLPKEEDVPFPLGIIPAIYALKFIHKCQPGYEPEEKGMFIPIPGGITQQFDTPLHLPPPPQGVYIGTNARLASQAVAEWLGKVEMVDKKKQLVESLRSLYGEISDIFPVPNQRAVSIYSRLDSGKSLPIRVMGDGINKLLHYLSAMIANPGSVFLLDEIETGFHHSFYSKMWKLIARVAKETGSQIFATTHSYECINAAHDGVSEVDSALLTYVRLGKEGESIVPHYFSGDDLAFVLEREMEVR